MEVTANGYKGDKNVPELNCILSVDELYSM